VFSKWWNRPPAGLRRHKGIQKTESFNADERLTVAGRMPETTGWKPFPNRLCRLKTRPSVWLKT
jgi:hypothetical protein